MIKILLISRANETTQELITDVEDEALRIGIDVKVWLAPDSYVAEAFISETDVILIGPDSRVYENDIFSKAKGIPMGRFDNGVYLDANGEWLLKQALRLLNIKWDRF